MADIRPFKALRFTSAAGNIRDNVCPPYDIVSEKEREALLKTSENNVIRLELPRGEDPYVNAGKILNDWLDKGILATDAQDGIYVYQENFGCEGKDYSIRGIICRVKLEEFSKGVVLPHEETLSKAKADRFNLMSTTYCNFSQVYSMYVDNEKTIAYEIDAITKSAPAQEFIANDGIVQKLWIETDKDRIEKIVNGFKGKQLYIADGHHRYETALNFKNKLIEDKDFKEDDDAGYIMMFLADLSDPGLVILPTHRLVKDIKDFNADKVLKEISDLYDVKKVEGVASIKEDIVTEKISFGFYAGGNDWYLLTLRDSGAVSKVVTDRSDAYKSLDVTALHSLILEPVFSIDKENMAQQKNLTYTRSIDEAIASVKNGDSQCAFILNATKIEQLRDVALAGDKMPQKSTYFYPKLITGLVMNKFR